MIVKHIDSMTQVDATCWNNLVQNQDPFLRHEFLLALEQSGSVCQETGWLPQHLLVLNDKQLIAAMPLYLKDHSWGEYVFDQQWADAYYQSGMQYYPKLVNAVPFTPCQGQRVLINPDIDQIHILDTCLTAIKQFAALNNISSLHCLFPEPSQVELLKSQLLIREGVQFQWFNNDFADFKDYLQNFTSRQRKKINKERRQMTALGITLHRYAGSDITEQQWQIFYSFYSMTYIKRGQSAYLNLDFFKRIATTMPEQILVIFALKNKAYVGAALSFVGKNTLYGRYWGCYDEYNFLHFETCYYQGLEYCMEHKLQRFDSGAQGEHKIARGFTAITTYSGHWLLNPQFATLVNNFLQREKGLIRDYKQQCIQQLPFKQH